MYTHRLCRPCTVEPGTNFDYLVPCPCHSRWMVGCHPKFELLQMAGKRQNTRKTTCRGAWHRTFQHSILHILFLPQVSSSTLRLLFLTQHWISMLYPPLLLPCSYVPAIQVLQESAPCTLPVAAFLLRVRVPLKLHRDPSGVFRPFPSLSNRLSHSSRNPPPFFKTTLNHLFACPLLLESIACTNVTN
jgi:hypothetical protein